MRPQRRSLDWLEATRYKSQLVPLSSFSRGSQLQSFRPRGQPKQLDIDRGELRAAPGAATG